MATLSTKIQNSKGNDAQWKENNGKVIIFPTAEGSDYICADAYQGSGSSYSEREETLIEIRSDQIIFQGTFPELTKKLQPKTIYQFYIDTDCNGMFFSKMYDDYDRFISEIKSKIVSWSAVGGDDPIAMEYYTQIANATIGQTNYSDTISIAEDEDSTDQITINIKTFDL